MGEASLFSPQMLNLAGVLASLGRPVEEKPDAHTGVESSAVDDPSQALLSTENLVDLVPRPLWNHHVVFETWDRVRLSGTPTAVSSERFQLADLEVSLVGVDSATAERDVLKSVPPARIIERASARVRDERRRVKAANQVDNLLQGYLEESTSTFADASSPPNEVESDQSVDHLLQSYMETETIEDQALDDLLRSYIDVPQPTAPSGASEVASDKSETTPRRGGVYIAPEVRVDSEQRSEGGDAPESAVIDGETKDSSVATPAQSADNLDDMLRSYLEPESEN